MSFFRRPTYVRALLAKSGLEVVLQKSVAHFERFALRAPVSYPTYIEGTLRAGLVCSKEIPLELVKNPFQPLGVIYVFAQTLSPVYFILDWKSPSTLRRNCPYSNQLRRCS